MEDAEFDAGAVLSEANLDGAEIEGAAPVEGSEQPETDSGEFDAESFMNETELETPATEGLLDLVNALGIDRKGEAVKFESDEEIREALSKGFDYTQKTQELAETAKQQEADYAEKLQTLEAEWNDKFKAFDEERGEYEEDRIHNQLMSDVITGLKETDPATFDEIVSGFQQALTNYNRSVSNPVVNSLQSQVKELHEKLGSKEQVELDTAVQGIEKEWTEGLSSLQSEYGKKLHSHGIKPNWDEVQNVWQAGNAGGANMTPKQAFFAVHSEALYKASQAKNKANQTALRSRERRGPAKPSANPNVLGKGQSDEDYIQELAEFARAQ